MLIRTYSPSPEYRDLPRKIAGGSPVDNFPSDPLYGAGRGVFLEADGAGLDSRKRLD